MILRERVCPRCGVDYTSATLRTHHGLATRVEWCPADGARIQSRDRILGGV